jgi:hypothetical protein
MPSELEWATAAAAAATTATTATATAALGVCATDGSVTLVRRRQTVSG